MRNRINLHQELVDLLSSNNVYFQPPESIKLNYPCIIYERYDIYNVFADDDIYLDPRQYRITVVDKNPDSEIVNKMAKFRRAKFVRHMVVDNLNHDTFTIYY